jgi:inorganic triphosphatase YgiF
MHEIELKFQIPPASRDALARAVHDAAAATVVRLQARYFDTPERLLGRQGFALRLRHEGDGWVQTLKGRGDGMLRRLEHNAPLPAASADDVPALSLARHGGTPAGDALQALLAQAGQGADALRLQFSTDITRTQQPLAAEGATIELALDDGTIQAGTEAAVATLPVHEIEFELLDGAPHGLLAQAYLWVEAFGLWLDVRSKAERGDRLARGLTAGAVPAAAVIDPQAPFDAQVRQALQPVLALAADVADELATPAHQVALTQAMALLADVLRRAGVDAWLVDTATLLAGLVFEPAAWRLPDTQRLWLALIGFTLPEAEATAA